jgi:cobalamin biosynthesis Mg chelatase CobN
MLLKKSQSFGIELTNLKDKEGKTCGDILAGFQERKLQETELKKTASQQSSETRKAKLELAKKQQEERKKNEKVQKGLMEEKKFEKEIMKENQQTQMKYTGFMILIAVFVGVYLLMKWAEVNGPAGESGGDGGVLDSLDF